MQAALNGGLRGSYIAKHAMFGLRDQSCCLARMDKEDRQKGIIAVIIPVATRYMSLFTRVNARCHAFQTGVLHVTMHCCVLSCIKRFSLQSYECNAYYIRSHLGKMC
jgi:hypothetical protein